MEKEYYHMAGRKAVCNGREVFQNEYFSPDGLTYGYVFKDERAFKENPGAVCYVPENAFDDADEFVINGETYYDTSGYTRNSLELLLEGETDDEGNPINVEDFFYSLVWCYPETRLSEICY